jgi:hypothetical protein
MSTLRKLWLAVENLAASLNCFAMTIDAVSSEVRQRVGIPADTGPSQLIESNGAAGPTQTPAARKRREL